MVFQAAFFMFFMHFMVRFRSAVSWKQVDSREAIPGSKAGIFPLILSKSKKEPLKFWRLIMDNSSTLV